MQAFEDRFEKREAEMKDYMYNLVDKVITEIRVMRDAYSTTVEKIPVINDQIENHEERI